MTTRTGTGPARDWTDLAPSEWARLTPTDWMEMLYGDYMATTPGQMVDAAYREMARPWQEAARAPGTGYGPGAGYGPRARRGTHRRPHDCGCGCHDHYHDRGCDDCPRCNADPCQCQCCIPDADLVVYGRLGETRVIPIEIENERKRAKDLQLDISSWSSPGGRPTGVQTTGLTPRQLTLGPCDSAEVTLVVRIDDADEGGEGSKEGKASDRERVPDVDDCQVAVADLRIEGCDHRPLRIAVAVLPRSCDPYTVTCGCGCC